MPVLGFHKRENLEMVLSEKDNIVLITAQNIGLENVSLLLQIGLQEKIELLFWALFLSQLA